MVGRQRPLRSVDREVAGRNTSEREHSPEIDRDRSSRPCPVKGKAEPEPAIREWVEVLRGSYRQHATKELGVNKGDPSGSGASL